MTEPRQLAARLLDAPDIAKVVPRLPPELLHRLIDRCGLEASVEIVALATPEQLRRLLDIDLWRAPAPGDNERLDGERFGEWLEVLMHAGADIAAERLAAMDVDLVIAGLADHVVVFDAAAMAPFETLDGEIVPGRDPGGASSRGIGGFYLEARRATSWDAIVELLAHLHGAQPAFFHRLMRGCVLVSDGAREIDGCDDLLHGRDQQLADLAVDRETRRDREGYVAPAQARAFLQAARALRVSAVQPPVDPIAAASLRDLAAESPVTAAAVAGLLERTGAADAGASPDGAAAGDVAGSLGGPAADEGAAAGAMRVVMEILADAGVVAPPRALLEGTAPDDTRLARVRAFAESHATAAEELGFLANALIAGGSLQDRGFTPQDASDVVLATCNLGLEYWPEAWPERDLVRAFQVGWSTLHREVCRYAAQALIDVLADISCSDRDVQLSLRALRREMVRALRAGEPWRVRQSLDAILTLDAAAWAGLLGLIDECPTLHAAVTSPRLLKIEPSAYSIVSERGDIAVAHAWLARLASALVG